MQGLSLRSGGLVLAAVFGMAALAACSEAPTAAIGDCIDSADLPDGDLAELPTVSCDESHDLEVFHAFDLDEGEFPGEDEMSIQAEDQCMPVFEEYVGMQYQQSEIWVTTVFPSQETWDIGDREVLCLLESEETTSLQDANR